MNLVFDLEARPDEWTIQGPASPRRHLASPLADERFSGLTASLREWASRPVPLDRPDPLGTEAFAQGLARRVSDRLTRTLLTEDDRRALAAALAGNGRARLVIRVRPATEGWNQAADAALALPWELLAPETDGVYPVRDGRFAVIREAVTDQAPDLPEPSGPLTLAVTIAAPEDRASFPHEQESFRLLAALAPLGQRAVFSNLGGLDDLAALVADVRTTAIHFRGHGLPGGLLFEDGLGFAAEVPVNELHRRLAAVLLDPQRVGTFPGLFFLAAPFTAAAADEVSAAAALHRSGFPQVIGFFGPVNADLNTRLEERFYGALAEGRSALAAVEEARAALLEPVGEAGERVLYPFGWSQLAVYHRGPDLPLARPGQGGIAPLVQRRTVEVSGLPVLEHGFIGRRGLQHEVRRKVERDGQRLMVIQGLGGLGKTALASQLLVRAFAPEPADQLVLRCRELMESDGDPVLELSAQAEEHGRVQGLPFWDERVKDLRERVPEPAAGLAAVLRLLRMERPGLALYIDNAETLQTGPATDDPAALGSWRPGLEAWWEEMERLAENDGCLMLVTTRYAWEGLSPRAHVGLPPMERADSLRLIDSFEALGDLPLEVRVRLAERVDGHPRTVEFLDRLIAQRREEIREVTDAWTDLIAPILPAQEEKIRADLLLEKLWEKLSEEAKKHARALIVLRRPAPQFVIDRMGGARDELIRAGWLTRYREQVRDDSGLRWDLRWSLHQLTRDFVSRLAEGASSGAHRMAGEAWESRLDQPLARREDQPEAIYHLHLLGEGNRAWPIVKSYVLWLRRNARFQEAQILLDACEASGTQGDALAVALSLSVQMKRARGEQGEGLGDLLDRAAGLAATAETRATLYHERASWLLDRSELPKAESHVRLALEEKGRDQGTETASYAQSLHLLGNVLHRQGLYVQSEQVLRECIRIKAKTQGESHSDFSEALHALASVLESMGHYEQAEMLLRQVIALEEETFGPDHPSSAATLHGLSLVLEHRGKYLEAEDVCRKALAVFSRWLGPKHSTTLASLHALAFILESRGDYTASEKLLRDLIEIKSTTLAPDHPSLLESLQVLAFTLWQQGKQAEAESVFDRASIFLERAAPGHPVRSAFLQLASNLLDTRGSREESEQLIQQAMTLERNSLSPIHPSHLVSLRSLASKRRKQGKLLEAEGLLRHAARVIEETQGVRHPHYGRTLQRLAGVLDEQGHLDESEALFRRSITILEDALGEDHPSIAGALNNFSATLAHQGRGEEAEPLLARALSIFRSAFGDKSHEVASVLSIRAQVWQLLGRPECQAAATEVLALYEEILGPDHPDTRDVAPRLRMVLEIGPSHDVQLTRLILIARALEHRGDLTAAVAAQEEVVQRARLRVGEPRGLNALRVEIFNLAAYKRRADRLDEAVALFEEAVEIDRRLEAPDLKRDLQILTETRELAALPREAWEARQAEIYVAPLAEQVRDAAILARAGDIEPDYLLPRAREVAERFVRSWPTSALAADFHAFVGALEALFREEKISPVPDRFIPFWEMIVPEDLGSSPSSSNNGSLGGA